MSESKTSNDSEETVDLQELAVEFDKLCVARHIGGAEDHGPTAFLDNDTLQMMAEELSDISNYCRYTYIKLRLMGMEALDASRYHTTAEHAAFQPEDPVPSSATGFVSNAEVLGMVPDDQRPQDIG